MLKIISIITAFLFLSLSSHNPEVGSIIDSHNGVSVYYNGKFKNVSGRNVTTDGYNLGLKWQCVEFAKRYYYEKYGLKMPDSYGHAKDFFIKELPDVAMNKKRGMWQYRNTRYVAPKVDDLIIYGPTKSNPFGHMGIITSIKDGEIDMIQQNMGKKSRQKLVLAEFQGIYTVADFNVLGWLRPLAY